MGFAALNPSYEDCLTRAGAVAMLLSNFGT